MSTQGLIQELSKDNLCTYFVLPLLKLSKSSFIVSNVVNTYLSEDHHYIVVKVHDVTLISRTVRINGYFLFLYEKDGYHYFVYKIPKQWKLDVEAFCKGRYSRMSEKAKSEIRKYSGLDYKKRVDYRSITDGRLLALVRASALLEAWERELDVTLDPNDELLSPPGREMFIKIEEPS